MQAWVPDWQGGWLLGRCGRGQASRKLRYRSGTACVGGLEAAGWRVFTADNGRRWHRLLLCCRQRVLCPAWLWGRVSRRERGNDGRASAERLVPSGMRCLLVGKVACVNVTLTQTLSCVAPHCCTGAVPSELACIAPGVLRGAVRDAKWPMPIRKAGWWYRVRSACWLGLFWRPASLCR